MVNVKRSKKEVWGNICRYGKDQENEMTGTGDQCSQVLGE